MQASITKKTRLFFLTTSARMAGAEKMLFELASRLDTDRYDVTVCTLKDPSEGPLLDKLSELGIRTRTLGIGSKWQGWKLLRLYGLLRRECPDVLQSFLYFDNIAARIFGRLARVPVIICGQRNARHEPAVRFWLDRLTELLCNKIVSNTRAGKDKLVQRHGVSPDKIDVIYNGVEPAPRRDDIRNLVDVPESATIVGFVGTLSKQKGLYVLLPALSRLDRDVVTVLIGDGPERTAIQKQINTLGLSGRVHLLGHVDEARNYTGSLDLLVLPSLREGMPNVLMEAMAQGTVCVATAVGGVPELLEDTKTGFLAEPGSVESLADSIDRALSLSDQEQSVLLQRASQQILEKFTFKKMIETFEGLYASFR